MTKTINVWARLGTSIEVNEELYKTNPEKALIEAIRNGNFNFDGDSYVPDEYNGEEISFDL